MLALAQNDELDHGAGRAAPGLERFCALTRTPRPADDMIRFVVGPGGEAVPDLKRKLPGRGIWITGNRAAIDEAIKRNVFARGFRRPVRIEPELSASIERLLAQSVLDALAIAGKAGQVISGFAKVETAIDRDDLAALLHASDAAADGKHKLDAALQRKNAQKSREIAIVGGLTGEQLDLALGRPNVVHAALLAGPGSETFLARVKRLERFRTGQLPELVCAHASADGARGQSTE